jgi:hypothetical protein
MKGRWERPTLNFQRRTLNILILLSVERWMFEILWEHGASRGFPCGWDGPSVLCFLGDCLPSPMG